MTTGCWRLRWNLFFLFVFQLAAGLKPKWIMPWCPLEHFLIINFWFAPRVYKLKSFFVALSYSNLGSFGLLPRLKQPTFLVIFYEIQLRLSHRLQHLASLFLWSCFCAHQYSLWINLKFIGDISATIRYIECHFSRVGPWYGMGQGSAKEDRFAFVWQLLSVK
jgi:hypothetical protein